MNKFIGFICTSTLAISSIHAMENPTPLELSIIKSHNETSNNNAGSTALMFAAQNNRIDLVKKLLDAKADPNRTNNIGSTALLAAIEYATPACAECLIDPSNINTVNNSRFAPLERALSKGYKELAQKLIDARADINHINGLGQSSLQLAASQGWADIVQMLIDQGLNANHKDDQKMSPLLSGAHDDQCIKILITAKADVNHVTSESLGYASALTIAALNGNIAGVKMLLEANAQIDHEATIITQSIKEKGYTALMLAALEDQADCVQALINAKANSDHKNNAGFTALMQATIKGNAECVEALLEANAQVDI